MRHLYTLAFALVLFLPVACTKFESGTYTMLPDIDTKADLTGNLYITNQTGDTLFLYDGSELIKQIPAEAQMFLVDIETDGGTANDLRIWKKSDVKPEEFERPDPDKIFRRWAVILSPNTSNDDERVIWVVNNQASDNNMATVVFDYPSLDSKGNPNTYSVDIFLNGKTGAKILSLAPGTSKRVGLEYLTYYFYYRYWTSDPNSTAGIKEIGWVTPKTEVLPYVVVLNANYKNVSVTLPSINDEIRVAPLKIRNCSGQIAQIWYNGELIEKIVVGENTQNISTIMSDGNYVLFNLNAPGVYTFDAKSQSTGNLIQTISNLHVIERYTAIWDIGCGATKTVTIQNNSGSKITLHDAADDAYLGLVVDAGETKTLTISTSITSLKAIDYWEDASQTWFIEGTTFVVNALQ